MFRYIDMPKLVAFYLREFSVRSDGTPSDLYKFVFCLCLPFISKTFRIARLRALAIAECTNSRSQILKVLNKITGSYATFIPASDPYYMNFYDPAQDEPDFPFDKPEPPNPAETPTLTYSVQSNNEYILIIPNGVPRSAIEAYISLLIPFWINVTIIIQDENETRSILTLKK